MLEAVCHNWKINEKDRFGMLLAACRDCIGDVRVENYDTKNKYVRNEEA